MKAYCAGNGQLNQISMQETANTLDCMHGQQMTVYWTNQGISRFIRGGQASSVLARDYKFAKDLVEEKMERKYVLRRLTPLECCRLQGFPDWWEDGVDESDSARYRMWGNGISLPCAADLLRRIAKTVAEGK